MSVALMHRSKERIPRASLARAGEVVSDPPVQQPVASTDPVIGATRRSYRRVVMTTCQAHGAAGFTNLLVTREDGFIVLNPHIGNCCLLRLDEQAATAFTNFSASGWDCELLSEADA
jgi:hypothetical protein